MEASLFCPKCQSNKLATSEFWHRRSQARTGFQGYCKVCRNNQYNEYIKNPIVKERKNKVIREWQKGVGKEKFTAIRKKYDMSPKRLEWRRKRYLQRDTNKIMTLAEAIKSQETKKLVQTGRL